ncbi:hypothetical protein KJA15_04455 [Patescibacteria group bacterium]|nr:hypothetical protein [Patescibacteria group bacterium]
MDLKDIHKAIGNQNKYLWENRLTRNDLENWFENFTGKVTDTEIEKKTALEILSSFIYHNEDEIRFLCKNAFNIFKNTKLKEFIFDGSDLENAKSTFNDFIKKCRFSHIGRPGESGGYILYIFRHANNLPIHLFPGRWSEITKDINYILFIDDFLGTGDTAINFWESSIIKNLIKNFPDITLYYLPLVALKKGVDNVTSFTRFKIISPQIFTEDYRVFSDKSCIFPDRKKREETKKMCEVYGEYLEGINYSLGYKDSQALVGLHHNIPDNTLPIIWSKSKGWYPIFKREKKRY